MDELVGPPHHHRRPLLISPATTHARTWLSRSSARPIRPLSLHQSTSDRCPALRCRRRLPAVSSRPSLALAAADARAVVGVVVVVVVVVVVGEGARASGSWRKRPLRSAARR